MIPANTYLAIVEAAKRERMSALYADLGINAAPAPACATLPVANWIRSNSYSDMSPSRRQNDTSAASKSFGTLSMTDWALIQTRRADIENRWATPRSPLAD
jgi:hypothetical protein